MKPLALHEGWLGALITLEVAAQFVWLSAIAIALHSLESPRCEHPQ